MINTTQSLSSAILDFAFETVDDLLIDLFYHRRESEAIIPASQRYLDWDTLDPQFCWELYNEASLKDNRITDAIEAAGFRGFISHTKNEI